MGLAIVMVIAYIPILWWAIKEVIQQNKDKNRH